MTVSSPGENYSPTILLLDDNESLTFSVSSWLEISTDWKVVVFHKPSEALTYLYREQVDVILTDLIFDLPTNEMNGLQFLIAAQGLLPHAALILMTAFPERARAIEKIQNLQLYSFVEKPWNGDDLLILLRNAVEKSILSKKLHERIYELEEVNAQLELAKVDLQYQKKQAAIGELIQGICHNLNTPISLILGGTELLEMFLKDWEKRPEQPPDWREHVESIREAGRRIQLLTENLMIKSRMEQDTNRQLLSLNQLLQQELVFLQADSFLRYKVKLDTNFDPSLPAISLNYGDISQVIDNLVRNALHALQDVKGPKLHILTKYEAEQAIFEVHDNGPGVPLEHQDRIFNPFFSTKIPLERPGSSRDSLPAVQNPTSQEEGEVDTEGVSGGGAGTESQKGPRGTGLGLSSSVKILESYNGTIEYMESFLGGACFRVVLPVNAS